MHREWESSCLLLVLVKAIFGQCYVARTLDKLKQCDFTACDCILLDDFNISSMKDLNEETLLSFLKVDVNNDKESGVNARFKDIAIPFKVRRVITTNCKDFESLVKIAIDPDRLPAIMSRCEWIDLHRVILDGCTMSLVPQMDQDALAAYAASNSNVRIEVGLRAPKSRRG